ncbi:MAG: TIGR00730 family Rossman fold protein [Bacteroidales bacterium]|nr:TIGR00730 family Rossman fold protein [Bacteroidales bacterium]
MKSICIFCGSSMGKGDIYKNKAKELGKLLAKKNIALIYGGADIGIMRILADTVLENGGKVIGVMPKILEDKEITHKHLTELHIVEDMAQRKKMMADLADAFITLPGGFGTLDELSEILTWYQLEITEKPLAIFNINGFFDEFLKFLDTAVEQRFLRIEHRKNIIVEDDEEKLLQKLQNYTPIKIDSKWVDELKLN